MKFSSNLVNFDENKLEKVPEVAKELVGNAKDTIGSEYQKLVEEQKARDEKLDENYKKALKSGKTIGKNGIEHDYVDVGHELKEVPGKVSNLASKIGKHYLRDAKEAYHGFKGELADKRDEEGNPISYKKKDWTLFKTEEDKMNDKIARLKGERSPNNNAITGSLGFRTAEVAAPFLIGGAFLGHKLFKKKRKQKAYQALLEEGYSPNEAKKLVNQINNSEQVNNSKQTNFGAERLAIGAANSTKSGLKWLLEHGLVAPFKGRKVTTAYNPMTGKIEPFKDGIIAKKDILDKNGNVITKAGDYIREGGITGATTLPGKVGMGVLGAANVGLTASLITMPASIAADFKRNAEYNKKYVIDPNKHYVLEQDLADNKKVRLIGKTSGYIDRTDANIEADRYAGSGMYQVYAIKGSELARIMPRKFTLEYEPYEY